MTLIRKQLLPKPVGCLLVVMLVALYVQAWSRTRINVTDFPAFYVAGRLLWSGGDPYSRSAQCELQARIRSDLCMPNPHAPVLLPLFAIVSTEDFRASYVRWSVILVLVLSVCALVAYKLSGSVFGAVCMVLFQPIFISVTQGNVTPFILLGVLLWVWLLHLHKDFWAGLALSLTVIKPQLALALAIPMVFVRPKAFWGFCVGGGTFALMGLALVGVEGYRSLLETITVMMRGQEEATDPAKMFSITGLLTRAGLGRLWAWPIYAAVIVVISWLWRKRLNLHTHMLGIVLAVFASPHLFTHDLSLLAIPLLLVNPLTPILASCLLLLALAAEIPYAGVYVVMGVLILLYALNASRLRISPQN